MNQIFMFSFFLSFISHVSGAPIYLEDNEGLSASIEDRRTLLNIVWSCLATIFACTWLAVHPNVPGRNITAKGSISCAIERVKIMTVAILAPEVIVAWAAEQFMVARKLRHDTNIPMAHGFFLSMGGFYYTAKEDIVHPEPDAHKATYIPPSPSPPPSARDDLSEQTMSSNALLSPNGTRSYETVDVPGTLVDIWALEEEPSLVNNLKAIRSETIEDKNKGDALSKIVSIFQISWFIAQCIGRAVQHLPITLLEMTALAFSGFSMITYCLWWYKPLNVKYHISLDGSVWSESRLTPETRIHEKSASPSAKNAMSFWSRLSMKPVMNGLLQFFGGAAFLVTGQYSFEGHNTIGDGTFRFSSGADHDEWSKRLVIIVGVGFLLGVFHCAAWSFYFPSHAEMVLWRFSSLGVVIGLFAVGFFPTIHMMDVLDWELKLRQSLPRSWIDSWFPIVCDVLVSFIFLVAVVASAFGVVVYIIARITLIILAFMQLRSLPSLAFHTVQWSTYIPHI
ncbi:uncharacterized protein EV420DRAFT_1731251 [Desarmillaria tabescens]|uniref:Uncharacterized protein n=1 Tax=Armillaria tabescens TaxID=1929756 RepID=A0AA39MNA0_ARMTA|nr:uncharacterized protein EV420DRAFT_1731251 [Desarmillaria tabescens]KAK0440193.1 hypothetical protein EV420DRAFT_1731251 [Desarmillaria tabescens]